MKQFKYFLLSIFVFTLCAANTIENKYILATGYTVTISGTSNFHDWDEKVGTVTGNAVINWNGDKSFDLTAMNIKMDVHSIKSNEGSAMNNNTYKALKADANPEIIFVLNTPISVTPNSSINTFSAKGKLTIAGVTKPVQMQVKLSMQGKDELIFEGSQTIKMTDYGVNPPTALFGTLKTGNDIVISFKTSFVTNN
jgi:polyisoprenoid-binding protein YceI